MQDQLCLACSSTVSAKTKPASVFIHSCCSKPVCGTCLAANPRLATFCPICEDATSAFNQGPRADVTRKGQIVFDSDKHFEPVTPDSSSTAPPPYSEATETTQSCSDFVIEDEDEDVRVGSKEASRKTAAAPDLLNRHSGKSPAGAELDMTFTGQPSSSRVKVDPFQSERAPSPTSRTPTLAAKEGDGQTRQYWLQKQDTLQSIAIRFGVSSNELCLLNILPRSVLSTSPHLLHTRSFILIPAHAVEKQLSSNPNLSDALQGPPRRSAKEKTISARRGAEAKFRALLLRDTASSRSEVETYADERAARAYIGLAEDEFRFIDFGEGTDKLGLPLSYLEEHDGAKDTMAQAQIDTARTARFDAILSQAIARWEMDSDWERSQRSKGLDPTSISKPTSAAPTPSAAPQLFPFASWFSPALHSKPRRGLFSPPESSKCGAL